MPRNRIAQTAILSLGFVALATSCSSGQSSSTSATTVPKPTFTASQKDDYLTDLAKNDSASSTYLEQPRSGVRPGAPVLAYGLAFCSFLQQGASISTAISSLDSQAGEAASDTGFTASQQSDNAIGTDALIVLCPSEQSKLTAAQLAQLQQVRHALGGT